MPHGCARNTKSFLLFPIYVTIIVDMEERELVENMAHHAYYDHDFNCARTVMIVLSKLWNVPIEEQTFKSAVGLHGAGGHGDQCGLVEGSLMYIGILCPDEKQAVRLCNLFAGEFQKKFSSLLCRELRPEGFKPGNPPHLCEKRTVEGILFTNDFLKRELPKQDGRC